jgi:hypothetical protein
MDEIQWGSPCGFAKDGAVCGRPAGHPGYHATTPIGPDLGRRARKVVQLVAASTGSGPAALVALADDGTAWLVVMVARGGYAWQQLPDLPPAESA